MNREKVHLAFLLHMALSWLLSFNKGGSSVDKCHPNREMKLQKTHNFDNVIGNGIGMWLRKNDCKTQKSKSKT